MTSIRSRQIPAVARFKSVYHYETITADIIAPYHRVKLKAG